MTEKPDHQRHAVKIDRRGKSWIQAHCLCGMDVSGATRLLVTEMFYEHLVESSKRKP